MSKAHIDYLVEAGLECDLTWMIPHEIRETDYQRGSPCGPTAIQTAEIVTKKLSLGKMDVFGHIENADQTGQMLWRENHLSVNHRYDELPKVEPSSPYIFERPLKRLQHNGRLDPMQVLKAIDCYEYQSCEHPGWLKSEAKAYCGVLRRRIVHSLPGYDEASWGID